MNDAIVAQRELFSLLDEFFRSATGRAPKDFASLDKFPETVRAEARRIGPLTAEAFGRVMPELARFYQEHMTTLFNFAGMQGGVKIVLGGTARFGLTQLNAVRRLLLYADTVLIPDPVLPWIEMPREEEKFQHVELLQAMFFLLRLKPLVDGDFGYPPVIVFQSWERALAQVDGQTQRSMENFVANVVSATLGVQLANLNEIFHYANGNSKEFLHSVAAKRLFVAPGGAIDEPLEQAVSRYKEDIRHRRTGQHLKMLENLTDSALVCNGILERLEPQFHLIENANELRAQPLLAIRAQAHYFSICASSVEQILIENEVITPITRASVLALADQQFERLGNAPIAALVEMRKRNENEQFRAELAKAIGILGDASLSDLNRVAAEVTREVGSLLNKYRTEARRINEAYRDKYRTLAATGVLTLGGFAIPFLSPLLGIVPPLLITQQYIQAKLTERRERQQLSGSLIGILANTEVATDAIE